METILVEDEPQLAARVARSITSVGHAIRVAEDGPAALCEIGVGRCDLVILDVNFPGMDGFEVLRRMFALQKMRKSSHTIILGDDANLIAKFPQEAGKVTVLKLSGGKVESVEYWNPGVDPLDGYLK